MYFVRIATAADGKKIARIHVRTRRVTCWDQASEVVLDRQKIKLREAYWHNRLKEARGSVFVIEGDDLVGFCDLIPSRDKSADSKIAREIAAVYVVSGHFRAGAGKALCYEVLAQARKQGCKTVTLWVLASSSDAMRFYEGLGFARDGTFKIATVSDGTNLHEIRYRKNFNRPGQT
jgi:GNAT superfamily N-acetyltransferase